jgi:zinc protease
MLVRLKQDLGRLPAGSAPQPAKVTAQKPKGLEVDIIKKETRATAISLGHPIDVTRSHPDFAALSVARAWLGEHRASSSHLFQRIREVRGMNYGDYAYIEAFPRGMFQFFPDPNLARQKQIFEIWIRPVAPENATMALKIGIFELRKLIDSGLSQEDLDATRNYLMKNVFLLTASQDHQLGYALDAKWYGTPEFTSYMRERLAKLTRDDVNAAIKRHLSGTDLKIVIVTKDAEGLKQALLADTPSVVKYDAPKPPEILEEDKLIGALKFGLRPDAVTITPVDQVFAK